MIEMWVIFIVWGLVCYRIGFDKGSIRGAKIGVETTMIIVSEVVSTTELVKITLLARNIEDKLNKTKTGQ